MKLRVTARILSTLIIAILGVGQVSNNAHAAGTAGNCLPGTGMATLTNNAVNAPAAANYQVWVRMASGDPLALQTKLEVTPSGGTPTCYEAINPAPTTTAWQWVNVGLNAFTATGNTLKLVGVNPGVRVDRVILLPETSTCIPSNVRDTAASPVVEPGDNCIVASPTTSTTIIPTTTITPTTTFTPSSPPPPPPTGDTTAPTAPSGARYTISYDATRLSYYVGLTWRASTDNVGVTGYAITRNGQLLDVVSARSYKDYSVQQNTYYNYTIAARDAAGNVSPATTVTVKGKCVFIICFAQ